MRTIIFDVESTGTTRPQVCQLAYIIAADDGLKAQNYFFEADAMNRYAYKVHHLSLSALKTLSGGQRFADRAGEIRRDFSSADVFAGHGVGGDVDYLKREFARLNMRFPDRPHFCTMTHFTGKCSDAKLPSGKPKPPRLSEVWGYFGLSEGDVSAALRRRCSARRRVRTTQGSTRRRRTSRCGWHSKEGNCRRGYCRCNCDLVRGRRRLGFRS